MDFKFFGFSDVGKCRERNEDRYLCNNEERLFLVADGMGGHASGDEASLVAVEALEEFIVRSRKEEMKWPIPSRKNLSLEQNRLLAGVIYANRRIREVAGQNPSLKGMGTTLLATIIEEERLAVVNVGDSRLYRIRNGQIEQLTRDHSVVAEQERNGMLTESQAKRHPWRHILTSALGLDEKPKVDLHVVKTMPEDLFLLCTDGLYNMLSNDEILTAVGAIRDKSLYKMGVSLVLKANLAGGTDNIAVVLLAFSEEYGR
jgi:serine/threonine protein phosphatase PrpC